MLEYNVLIYDYNNDKVETYNIFKNYRVKEYINKLKNKKVAFNKDDFKAVLQNQFWCRFEYEFHISSLFNKDEKIK